MLSQKRGVKHHYIVVSNGGTDQCSGFRGRPAFYSQIQFSHDSPSCSLEKQSQDNPCELGTLSLVKNQQVSSAAAVIKPAGVCAPARIVIAYLKCQVDFQNSGQSHATYYPELHFKKIALEF